ncbi:hypothetical protein C8R45DRAFT_947111 [Mycena sanguinolenta]|nr:hypothetical protein C8R45DRAFT_947111 [Mycena sanguinolenta]
MSRASNIRKERIADIVARVKAVETEPADGADRFLDGAMFKAILTRHKYAAIDAAVLNEWHFFDPTIADASCEMRPPLYLVMDDDLQAILEPGDQDLARAHREAHAKDKTDTQVRNVQQALGTPLDPAYQDLVTRIETALGEERMSLLALSYTFTHSSVWSKDEFQFPYSFRSKAVMDVAGEDALESGDTRDLIKLEQVFRSTLAVDAVALFKDMVDTIPPHETAPENAPQYFIENQLSAAIRRIQSRIPYTVEYAGQSEEEHIPLLPIFNQILAILYLQYNQRRNIVIRVKRKELTALPASSDGKQRYSEKHAGTYKVMFEPDEKTGLFRSVAYSPNPNVMVFDCFSSFIAGTYEDGLDASDLKAHRKALEHCNIAWLLLQYAAAHPAYAATAEDEDTDFAAIYDEICMSQPAAVIESFKPTREHFKEFSLKMNLPNERRPNVHNLWVLARKLGEQRTLHDNCQILTGLCDLDLYERINRAIDIQVDHIYTASSDWLDDDTAAFTEKHNSAPNASFGPFVVRIGDTAASCTTYEDAKKIIGAGKPNKRWALYKKMYPNNAPFAKK